MTPSGSINVLHAFTGGADGAYPGASLIQATDGDFYGTTYSGGASGTGVVFRLSPRVAPDGDFDGDGKADIAVYRPSTGGWYVLRSSTGYTTYSTYSGVSPADVPVRGDFDGDGKDDIAVYRPSNGGLYILQSSTSYTTYVSYSWGIPGDVPVAGRLRRRWQGRHRRVSLLGWHLVRPAVEHRLHNVCQLPVGSQWRHARASADFDGDGKTDIAAYRPSTGTWYVLQSSTIYTDFVSYVWGAGWRHLVLQR